MAATYFDGTANDGNASDSPISSLIDAATYCDLAISPRKLERVIDAAKGIVGLRDIETGEQFILEAKTLVAHGVSGAAS